MSKMTPRDYQARVHTATMDHLWKVPKTRSLVLEPTGVGKSVQIAMLVDGVLTQVPQARILMLTHSKELVEQNFEKLANMTNYDVGLWSSGLGKADYHAPVVYGGIQTVANNPEMLGRRDIIIVDEAHRVSPDKDTEYQKVARYVESMNPNASWIGYTATDYRLGQGLLTDEWYDKRIGDFVEPFWKDTIIDLTTTEEFNWFIKQGYLKRLVPRPTNAEIDVSGLRKRAGEYVTSDVEKLTNTEAKISSICDEICEMGFDRRSWMVFSAGNANSELVCAELNRRGVSSVSITDKTPKKEREQAIKDFKAYKIRCLVNNNILTTGFDHTGVDLIAVVRVTASTSLWCLSDDTEILTDKGWLKKEEARLFFGTYKCASVDEKTLEMSYSTVSGFIDRPLEADEHMINLSLPKLDFSVSNKHRMLIRTLNGRAKVRSEPFFTEAENLVENWRIDVPVSCVNNAPRSTGLSDDELSFIGLWLADGTHDKSNNTIAISQSDRYPHVQSEIVRTAAACGIRLRMSSRTAVAVSDAGFDTTHGAKRYVASYGLRTDDGWRRYEEYINKNICEKLFNCNRDEFTALLYGINLGDGAKSETIGWTRRTIQIAAGNNKLYAERLQIMAIRNGYSCSIVYNGNGCYLLNIKDQLWKAVCKPYADDTRNWITEDKQYSGNVWCVENEQGTLITRRNGKVVIMGNCQMLGRGTRPVYVAGWDLNTQEGRLSSIAASGVHNCLVLDFAGNSKRLGAINAPVKPKMKGQSSKAGDMPVKICGKCGVLNATIVRFCEYCGNEFPITDKLDQTASTRDLIVEKEHIPDKRMLHVTSIQFTAQSYGYSDNGSSSRIRATYRCGRDGSYHETLSFSGEKSSKRIKEWWTAFGDGGIIPRSNDEFLKMYSIRVKTPKVIEVYLNHPKKPKPEIIYYGFEDASYFDCQSNDVAESV